jgi:hypothetical protein
VNYERETSQVSIEIEIPWPPAAILAWWAKSGHPCYGRQRDPTFDLMKDFPPDPTKCYILARSPSDGIDGLSVQATWSYSNGRVSMTRLDFIEDLHNFPNLPTFGPEVLKRLPLSEMQTEVDAYFGSPFGASTLPAQWITAQFAAKPRPGRAGRPDVLYAVWAARYVDALAGTKAPIAALVKQYENTPERISAASLRAILNKARGRKRQLLTKAPAGRAGGELTKKAEQLLEGVAF